MRQSLKVTWRGELVFYFHLHTGCVAYIRERVLVMVSPQRLTFLPEVREFMYVNFGARAAPAGRGSGPHLAGGVL
jgi:hypothetical protein